MNKSLIYLITFVLCFLLQAGLSPAIAIAGCAPNFLIIPVLLVALRSGVGPGGVAGFFCGLMYDLMGNGTIGCMALVLTITALVVGFLARSIDITSPVTVIIVVLISSVFAEVAYGISVMLTSADATGGIGAIFAHSLPTSLYSAVFAVAALLICGLFLGYEGAATGARIGRQIGGRARKMPRMKSRLK